MKTNMKIFSFLTALGLMGAQVAMAGVEIGGNVFGGGRMANVNGSESGTTATVTVYASTIGGDVYGGNDITGNVTQLAGDANASATVYVHDTSTDSTKVTEVYGGGNGYYKYVIGDVTIEAGGITDTNRSTAIPAGTEIKVFEADANVSTATPIVTYTLDEASTYGAIQPEVTNTRVVVGETSGAQNRLKLTSAYGGAKNADVLGTSSLTVNSGTVMYAFAGNNIGGNVLASDLTINGTSTGSDWSKAGTDWGILEAYGGGNKVPVGTATVTMNGGRVFMLFGGGNAATATNGVTLTFNCPAATQAADYDARMVFGGNNQADMYVVPDMYVKRGKVENLYGGGNAGDMKGHAAGTIDFSPYVNNKSLPENIYNTIIPLFSGTDVMIDSEDATSGLWIENVYGGCRAANVDNSTYVRVTKAMHLGNVFGGCDIAGSVGFNPGKTTTATKFTTYKEGDPFAKVKKPVSKDNMTDSGTDYELPAGDMVYASTYLMVTGGTVSGNIFGSGNGNYLYEESGSTTTVKDNGGSVLATFDNTKLSRPFVTSARVSLEGGTVKGKVYGGGFNAELGRIITANDIANADADHLDGGKFSYYGKTYDEGDTLSRTSYLLIGKSARGKSEVSVTGDIFGGGCMSDVLGTMDIIVKNGTTLNTLYAGNDVAGRVIGLDRGQIQAHAGGSEYYGSMLYGTGTSPWDSFNGTELTQDNACTYIRVEDGASITTLFGGGNGSYDYSMSDGKVKITEKGNAANVIGYMSPKSGASDQEKIASIMPQMKGSWLDVKGTIATAYGSGNAADNEYSNVYITGDAKVTTAYAGGNAATVTKLANLWIDCNAATPEQTYYNVTTAFGGNNVADMWIVPYLYLQRGKVGTVYGGGNAGDMKGYDAGTVDFSMFLAQAPLPDGIYAKLTPLWAGTDVMVDSDYGKDSSGKVTGSSGLRIDNVYGGCRAANVDNSSYVRVTHADYVGNVFGGCDIAGSVGMNPGKLTADQSFSTYVPGQGGFVPVKDPDDPSKLYKIGAGTDMLYSSTYILQTGGTVSGNIYGSGNGNYQYSESGDTTTVKDLSGNTVAKFNNKQLNRPFAVSATVSIEGGNVAGNVYGGGLSAELGHIVTQNDIDNADSAHKSSGEFLHYGKSYSAGDTLSRTCYMYIGHTARAIDDNVKLDGNVFGGGCLANVFGVMDIIVKDGAQVSNLYAGNDASGKVFGTARGSVQQLHSGLTDHIGTMLLDNGASAYGTNHYDSYNGMELNAGNAGTYVRVEGGADIGNLYGGGNGDYDYSRDASTGIVSIYRKGSTTDLIGRVLADSANAARPVQKSSFLDVAGNVTNVYGGGNAANVETSNAWIVRDASVETAFGGGNAATVLSKANIWVDCNAASTDGTSAYNVKTLFGGNNTADMDILPTLNIWCGKIGTVYGGSNEGDMHGHDAFAVDFSPYISTYWTNMQSFILSYDTIGALNKWANPLKPEYFPVFSATEVLVDSPYMVDGGVKTRLTGNEDVATLEAYPSGLRIDNVYGGCRAANVDNSTYTRLTRADYIGRVFGGNDIAGTVGLNPHTVESEVELVAYKVNADSLDSTRSLTGVTFKPGNFMMNAGSYVCITGGHIDGTVFGGGNGEKYSEYTGTLDMPWSTSTYVTVEGGKIEGAIYGGGNMAGVGRSALKNAVSLRYNVNYAQGAPLYGESNVFVGESARRKRSLDMTHMNARVFGGSRMADTYGSVDVIVKNGVNMNSLFLGNDVSGRVVGNPDNSGRGTMYGDIYKNGTALKNTILMDRARESLTPSWSEWSYLTANNAKSQLAFNGTVLDSHNATAYLRVEEGAVIENLYGGGNGDYTYTVNGGKVDVTALAESFAHLDIPEGTYANDTAKIEAVKPYMSSSWMDVKGTVTNLYGGGNAASSANALTYIGDSARIGYAYAGGNAATVTASASIIVNDSLAAKRNALKLSMDEDSVTVGTLFGGNNLAAMAIVPDIALQSGAVGTVFAGGNEGAMIGADTSLVSGKTLGTHVNMTVPGKTTDMVVGSLFGGGNKAGVTQSTYVDINGGTITEALYGGCNTSGEVSQDSYVNIHKAVIGTDGVAGHVVFGGGYGAGTNVAQNVYVTVDGADANIHGNVYGGGRQGPVNTDCDNVTQTTLSAGNVYGDVYGGAYQASVKGQIVMDVTGTAKVLAVGNAAGDGGNLFAANNQGGAPECDITVNYSADGDCETAIYGGGNLADYYGNSQIVFTGGRVGYIYGGANKANVLADTVTGEPGNSTVYLLGGEVCHDVYGGGRGELDTDVSGNTIVIGGNVDGNAAVYVLDDRLDADGKYVIFKDTDGNTTTSTTGLILVDDLGMPVRPKGWTESMRSTIKVGGNIFGGGKNGIVKGNSNAYIGARK